MEAVHADQAVDREGGPRLAHVASSAADAVNDHVPPRVAEGEPH
jgi:hypothetical protein